MRKEKIGWYVPACHLTKVRHILQTVQILRQKYISLFSRFGGLELCPPSNLVIFCWQQKFQIAIEIVLTENNKCNI